MTAAEDKGDTAAQHNEKDLSNSGDSGEEKGIETRNVYPLNDEDYVVTFKTWIVVTIMASAYGVSTGPPSFLYETLLTSSEGLLLDCPCHWCDIPTGRRTAGKS